MCRARCSLYQLVKSTHQHIWQITSNCESVSNACAGGSVRQANAPTYLADNRRLWVGKLPTVPQANSPLAKEIQSNVIVIPYICIRAGLISYKINEKISRKLKLFPWSGHEYFQEWKGGNDPLSKAGILKTRIHSAKSWKSGGCSYEYIRAQNDWNNPLSKLGNLTSETYSPKSWKKQGEEKTIPTVGMNIFMSQTKRENL